MRDKIRYLLFKYWEESIQICFYAELFRQKNAFLLPSPLIFFWLKRASFATKESLFFSKVGKVTFFVRKSFPCRYFALSLHLETDERRGLSRSRLPKVPSLCLRSAFALPPLWLRSRRRRKTQGNAAAETRHKRENFDIFAYWITLRPGDGTSTWVRAKSGNPREIYFLQDFWIPAAGGVVIFPRFAKSRNPREIYFFVISPRFLDFRRRRRKKKIENWKLAAAQLLSS